MRAVAAKQKERHETIFRLGAMVRAGELQLVFLVKAEDGTVTLYGCIEDIPDHVESGALTIAYALPPDHA